MKPSPELIQSLVRAWRKGASAPELAERFGLKPRDVWRICEPTLFGIACPERPTRPEKGGRRRAITDRRTKVRHLWFQGWSGKALAARFGVAKSTISLDLAGLTTRRRFGEPEDSAWPLPRRVRRSDERVERSELVDRDPIVLPSRRGPASRPERLKATPQQRAEIRQLRASGVSAPRIGKLFSLSPNTVRAILREEGRS